MERRYKDSGMIQLGRSFLKKYLLLLIALFFAVFVITDVG
jgi:hypothetical protein